MPAATNPVIVQSDRSVLLEVHNPLYGKARDTLAVFAELEKSPEYIHTYRITPLSLWNAASSGILVEDVLNDLERYSKFPLPDAVHTEIKQLMSRYGLVKLLRDGDKLYLTAKDPLILTEVIRHKEIKSLLALEASADSQSTTLSRIEIKPDARGQLKQILTKIFYPVEDLAGYVEGTPLAMAWRPETLKGDLFALRSYHKRRLPLFTSMVPCAGEVGFWCCHVVPARQSSVWV